MSFLENPLPIAVIGAIAATVALVVFLSRRSLGSLIALLSVVGLTLILLLVERIVVTDREEVEGAVYAVLQAVEGNDVDAVVASIDPAIAQVRADAKALMPTIKVQKARALSDVDVTIDDAMPDKATATFRAFLQGVHVRSGTPVAYVNQRVDVNWVRKEGRWLIDGYTAYFDDKPIDAVGSAEGNRPVAK